MWLSTLEARFKSNVQAGLGCASGRTAELLPPLCSPLLF